MRRRADGALELRVDGVFVMDDAETSSERLLARTALDLGARDVLVGGLGLGFTARELLAGSVRRVLVAEIEPELVAAMADCAIPGADLLADLRLEVVIADVADVVRSQPPAGLDAILLDVDNGPDSLVREENADLYTDEFAAACARALRPGGIVCYWSMADSTDLRAVLAGRFERVEAVRAPVRLQDRDESYWLLIGSHQILES